MVVNLIQGCHTELLDDEAYYWKFSTQLDWGYFDHPPMIALLIKLGYFLFKNELGARLFSVLLNAYSIFLTEQIIQPKDKKLFYVIILSTAWMHLNFLAIPDAPLHFFCILFFYLFKKYLDDDSLVNVILLGIAIAFLLYSKYNGVLLVITSFIVNINLVKRKSFWISLTLSILLFLPHILWQVQNEFPSLKFHLMSRNDPGYLIYNTVNFLYSAPLFFGPFMGLIFLYSIFKFKAKDKFGKLLQINGLVFYLFCLLLTLKGNVEANWIVPVLFPSIYLAYHFIQDNHVMMTWIYRLFPVTIFLLIGCRVLAIYNFLPKDLSMRPEFHNNRQWASQIKSVSNNRTVAFMNSFQKAAKYEFYSGKPSFSLNNAMGRSNQYELWQSEQSQQGEDVIIVLNYTDEKVNKISTGKGDYYYYLQHNLRSICGVEVTCHNKKINSKSNGSIQIPVSIKSIKGQTMTLEKDNVYLSYLIFQNKRKVIEAATEIRITSDLVGQEIDAIINTPLSKGRYQLVLSTQTNGLPSALSKCGLELEVE